MFPLIFLKPNELWQFVIHLKVKYESSMVRPYSGILPGKEYIATKNTDLIHCNMVIVGMKEEGLMICRASRWRFSRPTFEFLITEVFTKGGVVIKDPESIFAFLEQ